MPGSLSCLNVAGGDVRITFDKENVSETIRAKRIITDMLSRGYALLIEVDGAYQRAIAFDEAKGEYIVADFDPMKTSEAVRAKAVETVAKGLRRDAEVETPEEPEEKKKYAGRGRKKRVPMASTNAVGIARSAGG